MTDFILHSVPGSPYGRQALITLEEVGAPYRLAPIAPGASRSPEYRALHPFGKIPALTHGDFHLYETQAIIRYVDRVAGGGALTPCDPRGAARMDQALNISVCYLFQGVGNVIGFQRIVGPVMLGLTTDEAAIAAAMPQAHLVFNELGRLLGDQPFFTGEAVSLADISLISQMDFLAATPEWQDLTRANPNLVGWLARMNARPSLQATTWEKVAAMAAAAQA